MIVDGSGSPSARQLEQPLVQLNNELNVAFLDNGMAARMTEVFREDLKYTRQVTYEEVAAPQLPQLFTCR